MGLNLIKPEIKPFDWSRHQFGRNFFYEWFYTMQNEFEIFFAYRYTFFKFFIGEILVTNWAKTFIIISITFLHLWVFLFFEKHCV